MMIIDLDTLFSLLDCLFILKSTIIDQKQRYRKLRQCIIAILKLPKK